MNYFWIVIAVVGLIAVAAAAYKIFGINKVESWLLWAVTKAEAKFGPGTGKLKLAAVYDIFITKFPKLQAIIPFWLFSVLVDRALDKMREMLENHKISDIVNKMNQAGGE